MEEGDLIQIDIPARILEIVGIQGKLMPKEEIDQILKERRKAWKPREPKYKKGVLRLFAEHAVSAIKGGYMDFYD